MEETTKDDNVSTLIKQNKDGILMTLKPEQVERFKEQPRTDFDSEYIKDLAQSIQAVEQKDPIKVIDRGNGVYELIDGENRLRACIEYNIPRIRAIVYEACDLKAQHTEAVVLSFHRMALSHRDSFFAIKKQVEEFGRSRKDLQSITGHSASWIQNYLSFRKLPSELQDQLQHKKNQTEYLHFLVAKELVKLDDHEEMRRIYAEVKHLPPNRRKNMVKKLVRMQKPIQKSTKRKKGAHDYKRTLLSFMDRMSVGSEVIMEMESKILKNILTNMGNDEKTIWIDQLGECIANLSVLKDELECATETVQPKLMQHAVSEIRN